MKHAVKYLLAIAVAASSCLALAQSPAATGSRDNVLFLTREYTKPGKGGIEHDQAERALALTLGKAKAAFYSVGLNSMSGTNNALFLTWFGSFADVENTLDSLTKDKAIARSLEDESHADGALLESSNTGIYLVDSDDSYNTRSDIQSFRYLTVNTYHIHEGHTQDWEDLFKIVKDTCTRAGIKTHWGAYDLQFGGSGHTEVLISGLANLAEEDSRLLDSKKFNDALGDNKDRFYQLFATAVESSDYELYVVNPSLSYVPEDWVKQYPKFWKSSSPAAASASKPAAAAKK